MKSDSSRTLAGLLVVLIVTTVSILLAAVGAIAYRTFSQDEHRTFEAAMDLAADQLSVSLAPAAWNLDYEQVRKLMDSHMRNQAMQAVEVELDTARFALTRDQDWAVRRADGPITAEGLRVSERPVMFGEQEVGHIRQYASRRFLDEKLDHTLVTLVLFIVLLDAVLTLALYVAIQRMVVQPLHRVERYADEVAREGHSDTALGDLGFLGELQRLTRSIDAMVGQLGARNAELARSNERFQRVIRLNPLPINLFDRDGRILFVNDRFIDTFGYTLEDIPDAHMWFQKAYPDPAYRSEVLQRWSRELEASGRTAGLVRAQRYVVTCKDGSRKVVEISGMMSEDPNITVLNDITERTRVEEELARHRGRLEELVTSRTAELEAANRQLVETQFALDHSGVAIQWIDAGTGRFTYVNDHACTLYGLSRDGLIGMLASQVLPGLSAEHLKVLAPSPLEGGHTRMEAEIHRGDGRTIPIEIGLYFNPRSPDGARNCIAFCIDITQRREVEEALIAAKHAAESAAQARSEFLANMSHEIRTPMNAVIGMTRLALQSELDDRQRNYIAKANSSAVALLGILNDILDFSKVEAGHITLESVPFRLDRMLESVLSVVSLRAEEKALDLLVDVEPGVPAAVVGDPLRLGQILTNLAGNAIKFTEHGEVIIGCRVLGSDERGATLEFSVRDTGIGMNADQLASLFLPFTQGDASISRRFGGTGLGLAISRRLAELMGGTLQARSVVAVGSTFTLTAHFEIAEWPEGGRPELPDALRNRRVLVVDDNPEALQILCRDLEHLGLTAEGADSGAAALDMLASRPSYALMVCDWKMPGMDGIELIRTVQASHTLAHPPAVIMVSAFGNDDLSRASQGLSIAGVLAKPASAATLHDAVVAALGTPLPVSAAAGGSTADRQRILDSLSGRSVLLVEDNPVNQELGLEILRRAGMKVTVANNGAEALELLDAHTFDCVLMDVQMPVMDGLEATRRIRARDRLRGLPVIAMTAGAMSWERDQTREAGMNDHVTKPVDFDELLRTLVRWLGEGAPADTLQAPDDTPPALLDTVTALRAVNGAADTYHRILGVFENSTADLLVQLRNAQVTGDMAAMASLAHRGRGGAGAVGARALCAALEVLERACIDQNPSAMADAMGALEPVLVATHARIRDEITANRADIPYADFERLHSLLASNDSEALDVLNALRAAKLPSDLQQALQPVGRAADRYDFDQALQLLEKMRPTPAPDVNDGSSPNPPSGASPHPVRG